MGYWLKNILLGCSIFCIILLAGCNEQPTQSLPAGGLIGQPAPDFTLYNFKGEQVTLSELKGKVVILNFWATWCPPCREEMPSMEQLHRKFEAQGLVMLAVNVEENGADMVSKFLMKTPHSFQILLDTQADVQDLYQVFRFPETVIIDRNGIVVEKIVGARDWMVGKPYQLINFLLNG